MSVKVISRRMARHLHLAAQGLLTKPKCRAKPSDVSATISRMSLLQIDTINIVARSPYLVLFSRLGSYPNHWLDDALAQGEIFEYWAHEACFLPRKDFALVRHQMLNPGNMGWKYKADWMEEHAEDIAALLAHIEAKGPVRSADFAHPHKGESGWWEWKPHKRHLEGLFTSGQLMVSSRHNFQRIYDLTARVIPEWDDAQHLIPMEAARSLMLEHSARSLGVFRREWLADYYRLRHVQLAPVIEQWLEHGKVIPVEVAEMGLMYLHHSLAALLPAAEQGTLKATHSAVLSPFDPVVWDRSRAEQLFDFSYRLECYIPAPKRKFGYFVLPLLHKGALVGRMDAKMHRKTGQLEIINLYLEEGVKPGIGLQQGLQQAINLFARWQGANRVTLVQGPEQLVASWGYQWETESE